MAPFKGVASGGRKLEIGLVVPWDFAVSLEFLSLMRWHAAGVVAWCCRMWGPRLG